MRVLVCGSRSWDDPLPMRAFLSALDCATYQADERLVVIHGCAKGADRMAENIARTYTDEVVGFPADWDKHGKAAGHIRNKRMLDEGKPDLVVAFRSEGESKGTDNMILRARMAGVPVYVVTKPSAL